MTLAAQTERLMALIDKRSKTFVDDNFRDPMPTDYLVVNTAMKIGASIAMEVQVERLRDEAASPDDSAK